MAEKLDTATMWELLNAMIPADIDVERVFQKMIQPPYNGRVHFRHLKNMDPDDFNRLSDIETIKWFRRYPSKFVLFEGDNGRVCMCSVRIPSAKICLEYLSSGKGDGSAGCTDEECYKYHICRNFVAGYCKNGPGCANDHHFQGEHNKRLLAKQGLDKFSDEDLFKIFVNSQLRVCDSYNKSAGYCDYGDRCTRIHLCNEFVRGSCAGDCKLSHSLDDTEHTKRLRRYYALDDKPHQEVLRNLLIMRRRPAAVASSKQFQKSDLERLLQLLAFGDDSEMNESTSVPTGTTSSEIKSSSSEISTTQSSDAAPPPAAAAAAEVTSSSGDASAASWQLEVFGTWTSLSDTESAQIEKAFCDPNNDTEVMSFALSELGTNCQLSINLNKMTASLLLDDDTSQPCEDLKLRRTVGTSQWMWYWQHDDESWLAYTEAESSDIETRYQKNEKKFSVGAGSMYTINLSQMTQINKHTGRVRLIRRRPKSSTAQL